MSALVMLHGGEAVTTSLALAEGTGSDHASIIKLVRRYQSDLEGFGLLGFEIRPRSRGQHGGGDTEYALLNEHQATLLLTYMRNSDPIREFKKRLVTAFYELAAQQRQGPQIPQTLPEALRLAAELAEDVERRKAQIAALTPKADALDRIATADGSLCITDAAKALQVRPKDLFSWLQAHQWIYRRVGCPHWIGRQERVQAGLLEHKVTEVTRSDGSAKLTEQVRITPKGLAKLAETQLRPH